MSNFLQQAKFAVKNWWIYLIIGLLFIGLGIYAFVNKAVVYSAVATIFGIGVLISGLLEVIFSFSNREILPDWGWTMLSGIFNIIIAFFLMSPAAVLVENTEDGLQTSSISKAELFLPILFGIWVLFAAIKTIAKSFTLKSHGIEKWYLVLLLGLGAALFAIYILTHPMVGAATIVSWLAIALILIGITNCILALYLKKVKSKIIEIKDKAEDIITKVKEIKDDILE